MGACMRKVMKIVGGLGLAAGLSGCVHSSGQVAYLMNTELAYYSAQKNERAIVECQPNDCETYVLAGHRVVADGN